MDTRKASSSRDSGDTASNTRAPSFVPQIQVQLPEGEPKLSGRDTAAVIDGSNEKMPLRQIIRENIQAYIRGDEIGYLTSSPVFQDMELKVKECLRRSHVQRKLAVADIRQVTASTLLGIAPKILSIRLCDLIRDADNPDTLEELFDKMSTGEIWKRQAELEEEAFSKAEALLFGQDEDPYEEGDEDAWETDEDEEENGGQDPGRDYQENSVEECSVVDGESDPELFNSDDNRSQNSDCEGSPELFATPKHSRGARGPSPQKVGGAREFQNMITPLVEDLRFPSSKQSSFTTSPILAAHQPVFQFQGVTVEKEPRTLKPGEILFSASGSPVVATGSSRLASLFQSHTPTISSKRPVRLLVDNPDGRAIQVELAYRGRPSNAEEGQLFREFVTDVRGFITTRSTAMKKKLMSARVPNSAARKKPVWKV